MILGAEDLVRPTSRLEEAARSELVHWVLPVLWVHAGDVDGRKSRRRRLDCGGTASGGGVSGVSGFRLNGLGEK